ncbi:hypothetical protein [Lysinibacillus fusiformis]|uniref:hypothetical protein n=1 Tax=Lysinibacillus fusiformis TaxID=28031 RepID=UPI003016EF93
MKYYVRFCNKFEGNKIPDTFAAHYISAIYKGPNATSFTVAFGDEVYLLTNGYLFKSIFNSDSNGNSFTFDNVTFAPETYKKDWRFQKLSEQEIYKFFQAEELFKNLPGRKFTLKDKKRAAEFYKKRCNMVYDHRIDEFLAIDNIHHIELAENKFNFKFYFNSKHGVQFYYFGISPNTHKFEVW